MDTWVLLALLGGIVLVLLHQLRREIRRKIPPQIWDTAIMPMPESATSSRASAAQGLAAEHAGGFVPAATEVPPTFTPVVVAVPIGPDRSLRTDRLPAKKIAPKVDPSPVTSIRDVVSRLVRDRDSAASGFVLGEIFGPPISRRQAEAAFHPFPRALTSRTVGAEENAQL